MRVTIFLSAFLFPFSAKIAKISVVLPDIDGRTRCKHDIANRVNGLTARCTLNVHLCNGKSIGLICFILLPRHVDFIALDCTSSSHRVLSDSFSLILGKIFREILDEKCRKFYRAQIMITVTLKM